MPTELTPARAAAIAATRGRLAIAISILESVTLSTALTEDELDTVSTCITRLSAIEQRIYEELSA